MPFMQQVEKALSGSTTEDSSDESDTDPAEGTDKVNISHKGGGESEESEESGDESETSGRRGFPSLTTRTPIPSGNFLGHSPTICVLDGFVASLRI